MSDCIFCRIVSGDIPSRRVYENDRAITVMDIRPVSRGHLIVMPKQHSRDLTEMGEEDAVGVLSAVRTAAGAAVKATGAEGFNLIVNSGAAAGQVIFHTHLHVIPRFAGDGLRHWPETEASDQELDELAIMIRDELE
ncbi:MAG: HIT family protein [bacterium]